ncbi:tRNA lysidine(34) synthetase TilS [Texcoconibacillus texcoconensis]|uniref:tRNA(Ile)-lysidine synthase n=1 Tax=Texcoconibacillus texcoconensis TaxID=1095777 RepID=A0A840QUC3_9BACI|nr:tRNA lysidine(34) synthetase TilS [Texcoconibacillus texcoconensis]MBB5174889.1 tRNA(Ile)-lysidine synthase [Texcoconibacillus texcoconensis]
MNQAVKSFIRKHELIKPNDRVLIAVSGGPDSLALLHYLWVYRHEFAISIICASVDHGLRDRASRDDYEFVRAFCEERGIEFIGAHLDVAQFAEEHRLSKQVAARQCRYQWLSEQMEKQEANRLATAHHGDDQIETMLMQQVRGSVGYSSGVPVQRPFAPGMIIRPLLSVTKEMIVNYCHKEGLSPRYDNSNEDPTYTRNRFRMNVLPFLKQENPNVHQHYQQQSEWLQSDHQLLLEMAEKEIQQIVPRPWGIPLALNIDELHRMPVPLQRRGIHLILNYLCPEHMESIGALHIENVLHLCRKHTASSFADLPGGLRAERSYERLYIKKRHGNVEEKVNLSAQQIPVPGMIKWNQGSIKAEVFQSPPLQMNGFDFSVFDYDQINVPLSVRTRRRGDRIDPIGMDGSKKLKNLFIDEKIPLEKRNQWPIVVTNDDQVLWVPNLRASRIAQVSNNTKRWLLLYYDKW